MKIPGIATIKDGFYRDIVDQCFASKSRRIKQYSRNRDYTLWGCDEGEPKTLNKIGPHIELLSSYLFSAETTRFMIQLGQEAPKSELLKIDPMVGRLMDEWHDGGVDAAYSEALQWALIWDSTLIYLRWANGIVPYVIAPHDFGVYREDVTTLKRQEAFAIRIRVSKSQLETELQDHPAKAKIIASLTPGPMNEDAPNYPQAVRDIIATQVSPNIAGVVQYQSPPVDSYEAEMPDNMVTLIELRLWDDDLGDWRLVTQTETGTTIYDRKQPFIAHEIPVVQVRPRPMFGYFFGASEVTMLLPLQDAIAKRIDDIQHLLNKQVRPPMTGTGLMGDPAEMRTALDSEYGYVPYEAGGAMKELAPTMPADVFAEVKEMERLFNEASGIPAVLQGQGQPGARTKGQTDTMAKLGSGRIKRRAMVIEESLDDVATLMMKIIQHYDKRTMRYMSSDYKKEVDFLAKQFTEDFTVKVDSHSMSPVFIEDNRQLAHDMLDAGIITKERFVEMVSPMMKQQIKEELKLLEAAQQKAAADEKKARLEEASVKHGVPLSAVK